MSYLENIGKNAKKAFKDLKAINRKVIVATADEIKQNSRARSAKLRIAEKSNDN